MRNRVSETYMQLLSFGRVEVMKRDNGVLEHLLALLDRNRVQYSTSPTHGWGEEWTRIVVEDRESLPRLPEVETAWHDCFWKSAALSGPQFRRFYDLARAEPFFD